MLAREGTADIARRSMPLTEGLQISYANVRRVGIRDDKAFVAQWLAYALPCRRFAGILADACARLGADVDRYSFTARDLHPPLLAGFAGALRNPSRKPTLPHRKLTAANSRSCLAPSQAEPPR
jgi:hypothetical protein